MHDSRGGLNQVMLSDDMLGRLREQSELFRQGDLIRMIQTVTEVETSLSFAVMPVLRIETALARIANMETTVQLKSLLDRLGVVTSLEKSSVPQQKSLPLETATHEPDLVEGTPQLETGAAESMESSVYAGDLLESDEIGKCLTIAPELESIKSSWKTITERVGSVKPGIGPSLAVSVPESYEEGKLTLRFDSENEFHQKTVESNSPVLEEIIGAFLGEHVKISCYIRRSGNKKKQPRLRTS